MWHNLSYPAKTAMALAQRIALYTGRPDIEAVHIVIGALEVSGNAWKAATAVSGEAPIRVTFGEYLAANRSPIEEAVDSDLAESARRAIDAAHAAKRRESLGLFFIRPASWRSISTDQLVLGCLRGDPESKELLEQAGLGEVIFEESIAKQPSESRRTEPTLNGLLGLDPEDWLLRTD
ncbi:MAG TPA: hypothetical protein VG820_11755 [Fimbriimonadaceae bacterium]|nr:hypothetical protein [Fimbriimonadaceae bacterium]